MRLINTSLMDWKAIGREPLLHFLILGGLIFALYAVLNKGKNEVESSEIIIHDSDIERLAKAYQQNWNAPPDAATILKLLEEETKAEIFYREALAMNLDHNDEIIRRRLKQKYEFLIEDLAEQDEPTEAELKAFYQKNKKLYASNLQISFLQIYFSPDLRTNPLSDATTFLAQAEGKSDADLQQNGDDFHLQNFYADRDFASVRQLFGKDFADALFQKHRKAAVPSWLPPVTSGYGIHAVRITGVKTGDAFDFEQIKPQLKDDFQQERLRIYNENLFKDLKAQYEVVYDLDKYKSILNDK